MGGEREMGVVDGEERRLYRFFVEVWGERMAANAGV